MIQLSDHFTYRRLIRFTLPSIIMMIFTSIYGMVDGFFVSNYVGATQFAALNLIMPFIMIFSAVGFMFGTGGSALVSMTLGLGQEKRASQLFSMMIYILIILGTIFAVIGYTCSPGVAQFLGANKKLLPYCIQYARINMVGLIPFMLQNTFQSFLVTAERPKTGLAVIVVAGCTNMVLDGLFVGVFHFGLAGAAWATVISQFIGGLIPLFYFILPNKTRLHLVPTRLEANPLLKAAGNGSSEFLSNISMSVVNMLFNAQLIRFAGQNGIAAYGVIMYVNFIFEGVYQGYSVGSAPIVGYHYGAGNRDELRSILKKSLRLLGFAAIILTILAELTAPALASVFVGYDKELHAMTTTGFRIFSVAFLFMGFNIYASSFFTALNNGAVSALISFARTLLFTVVSVLVLPIFLGLPGIWWSVTVSELCSLALSVFCLLRYRPKYGY